MKKLKMIGAAAVIVSAAMAMCLGTTMGAQETTLKTVVVTITPHAGQAPSVDKPIVDIWSDQQVEWKCRGGCDFTVDFPSGTPFNNRKFDKANPRSGSPKGPHGTFKYSVTVDGHTLDPQIIFH